MQALPKSLPAFLWYFIKKQKALFFILFISPVALILESNLMPYAIKIIIDNISSDPANKFAEWFYFPVSLYIGSWVTMITIFRSQEWVCNWLHPKFQAETRLAVFDYVKNHSYSYFANNFAGSIANKISDISRTSWEIIEFIRWRLVGPLSVVLASITITYFTSPIFSLIIVVWVISHIAICYLFAIKIDKFAAINAEDKSTLSGKIVDVLSNISNVRIFSRFGFEQNYIKTFQDIEKQSNKRVNTEIWKVRLAIEIPTILMYFSIFYFLISGWKEGWVSSGDFVFIIFASFNILGHIWYLSMELPMFFSNIGISRQALTLISAPHGVVDIPDAKKLIVSKGDVVFENVNFHYSKGKNIFKDKTITINHGEKVGLVGFSGSGKSTFVNLILRFFDIESGSILIDGQDIKTVTQESLRRNIAMIPQDPSMFHRTIMENIRYGKLEATDEEVVEAAKKADCHNFIKTMAEGYNSLVGERGIKLSGGQRQRIAIARAILKNAPILILDEATSSLDSVTEKEIQKSIAELMKGKTSIIIAHRLSTLSIVDRVMVFEDGQVVEDGKHDDLLKLNGTYSRLWKMQAGGYLPEL